jgi:hypothetical protein
MPRKPTKKNNIRKDVSFKAKGKVKKKAVAKPRVAKTRNLNTLTESQYFQKIRSGLRNTFRYWKPMMKALELASRVYQGPNKRQKKEYQCAHCEKWFIRTAVQVDHRVECGSLNCWEDIVPFIQRLTPEDITAYQVLCKPCHKIKTQLYLSNKKAA